MLAYDGNTFWRLEEEEEGRGENTRQKRSVSVPKEDWHRHPGEMKARGGSVPGRRRQKTVSRRISPNVADVGWEVGRGGGAEPAGYLDGRVWGQMGSGTVTIWKG